MDFHRLVSQSQLIPLCTADLGKPFLVLSLIFSFSHNANHALGEGTEGMQERHVGTGQGEKIMGVLVSFSLYFSICCFSLCFS